MSFEGKAALSNFAELCLESSAAQWNVPSTKMDCRGADEDADSVDSLA
jgi:hypothetical protein